MSKSFTIYDLPKEERPRERLVKLGEQALSAQELLQLILGRGIAGESVVVTAQKLISQFGSLQKLAEASIEELSLIKGIGLAKATQIKATFEIGRRLSTQTLPYKSKELNDPKKVYQLIKSKLKDYHKEHFYIIPIDSRNWSIAEISVGTLNSNVVHPREVFAEAIKNKAASVIFAHNHPSGDPEPSEDDLVLTRRLVEAGKILGIEVLDHVIVSNSSFYSLKEKKYYVNGRIGKKKRRSNKIPPRGKYKHIENKGQPFIVRESLSPYGNYPFSAISQREARRRFSVISLFSGCGGLDLGFIGGFNFLKKEYPKNDFEIIWANDIDKSSCQTFANYFKRDVVCGDITQILSEKYSAKLFDQPVPESADVVLGGFPCQDFSHAGKRRGFNSKRGLLYQSMAEVIKRTKPVLFVAENVRGLLTINGGEAIQTIINDFEKLGYNVVYKLLTAADYGVPQTRERVIIVGTRKDKLPPFEYPKQILDETNWINLKQAIGDLEKAEEGKIANHYWSKAKKNNGQGNSIVSADKPGPTMRTEHHGNIEYHWNGKRRLSAREAARIQSFPDDFIFYPSTSSAYKQIGNAVPPVLAWYVAATVEKFLDKYLE